MTAQLDPTSPPALPGRHRWVDRRERTDRAQRAQVLQSEGAAAAAVVPGTRSSSLAILLTGHVLRDGEVVLLVLKPAFWFILFQSMRFAAVVILSYFLARLLGERYSVALLTQKVLLREVAVFAIAGRVVYAAMQWMGRLYVLTDLRVIRLAGVFNVDVTDCPLRKIAATEVAANIRERLTGCGTVEIHPKENGQPADHVSHAWQTVGDPEEVQRQIQTAIHRAQSGTP